MKSLAIGCSLLAFVACNSNPPPLVLTSSSGSGSSTGGPTSTAAAGTTGSSTGSSTGTSSGPGTTGSSSGGRTSTAAASSTGTSSGGNGTTTGSYIGLPCTFNATTDVDSCQPYGYECSAEYDTTDPATCVLPRELVDCFQDVGCQDGGNPELICSMGFRNNGKDINLCVYPCKTTNDCAATYENCLPNTDVCFDDYCDANAQLKFTPPFYNRCTVDDAGDTGQCLPFGNGNVAYCFQSGYDFTDEPCNPGGRVGGDSECDFGDYCIPNLMQAQAGIVPDGGFCLPITVDGGCPDGYGSFQYLNGADWQICSQDCSSTPCTVGTCYNITGTTEYICLPP